MSQNEQEPSTDSSGEGLLVIWEGRERSGFAVFWLWFIPLFAVLGCLAVLLDRSAGTNGLTKGVMMIAMTAFGPLSGVWLDLDVEHFRSTENQALREVLLVLPVVLPWSVYLLVLWKTRWGHAPRWVHISALVAWHFVGLITVSYAALKYT